MMKSRFFLSLVLPFLFLACDDGFVTSGSAVLYAGQGLNLDRAIHQNEGRADQSDIYVVQNGPSGLKVMSGGPNIVKSRPIKWFQNEDGRFSVFTSLDDVPSIQTSQVEHMIHAKSGYGFVVFTQGRNWVKGWISEADGDSLSLEWVHF